MFNKILTFYMQTRITNISNSLLRNYLLIFLGFLFVTIYLGFRFLRNRLPKDLPLTFLIINWLFVFFSLFFTLYVIFRFFRPVKINRFVIEFGGLIFKPLEAFDSFLRQYIPVNFLTSYVHDKLYEFKLGNFYRFYFFTNSFITLIISAALLLDVFIFVQFYYIYKVILLALIPLSTKYFIYSLDKLNKLNIATLSQDIQSIETAYVPGVHPGEWPENYTNPDSEYFLAPNEDPHDNLNPYESPMYLPLEIFIDYQTKNIIFKREAIEYECYQTKQGYAKYEQKFGVSKFTKEQYKVMERENKEKVTDLLSESLRVGNVYFAYPSTKYIKIFTLSIYVITWVYILFFKSNVLWMTGLSSLVNTLNFIEEPFSGCFIYL